MGLSNSIKHKLFFLLIVMGAVPFIVVIIISTMNMVSEWEISVEKNGILRNEIVSEHITELFEKNFYVLHATAVNGLVIDYLKNPQINDTQKVKFLLLDTNQIFRDKNMLGITSAEGVQLVRTDNARLVDISEREHFKQAMQGKDFVSDVILAMSTGELTVVLTLPVKDQKNNIVGILQRNFNLAEFQNFVETQDDEEISVIVLDRKGRIIANSDKGEDLAEDFLNDDSYKFISEYVTKGSGIIRANVDGIDSLVSYSQNTLTDWTIVTVQPYQYILNQVYSEVIRYSLIGLFMLSIVATVAYWTSIRATRPIIEITKTANKIASGAANFELLTINSKDEFGKMAEAFNKMRKARDAYQLEAKTDKLTKLYNKATFETICRMKLSEFLNGDNEGLMALYIIDLDHFKEINDTKGHQFGDIVLQEFSLHLKKCFRPYDCIARFGGDEFMVIIDHLPGTEIIIRKAEMINQIARELEIDGENAKISASIGIAIIPQHGTVYEEIFKAADKSLYFVKKNGRDGFHCENLVEVGGN